MSRLLLSPLSWCLLAVAAAWLAGPRRPRLRLSMGAAVALSLALMTPWGAGLLSQPLEQSAQQVEPRCASEPPRTIVVLGGGLDRRPDRADDVQALSAASARRVMAARQRWVDAPLSRVVIAGGGPYPQAESTVMAALALQLGIPEESITTETRSMNTAENLAQLATLQPTVDTRIWLVTSAMHLPRALATARSAGFQACASPADLHTPARRGLNRFLPQSESLQQAEDALHELVGMWVYRLRGQADPA